MSPENGHPCTRSSLATHLSPLRKFSWFSDPGCSANSCKTSSRSADQKFADRQAVCHGDVVKMASDRSRRVSTRSFIDTSWLIFMWFSGPVSSPRPLAPSTASLAFQSMPVVTLPAELRNGTTYHHGHMIHDKVSNKPPGVGFERPPAVAQVVQELPLCDGGFLTFQYILSVID